MMNCENYRSIKLFEHGLNILERIIDKRSSEIVDILRGQQYRFRKEIETLDAIFKGRQIMEKSIDRHNDLFLTFVELEKYGTCGSIILGREKK